MLNNPYKESQTGRTQGSSGRIWPAVDMLDSPGLEQLTGDQKVRFQIPIWVAETTH